MINTSYETIQKLAFITGITLILGFKRAIGVFDLLNNKETPMLSISATQASSIAIFFFCFVSLVITIVLGWIIKTVINKGQLIVPSEKVIDNAPIAWILRGFIGFIYVEGSGTQVGLVGNKIYKKSGFFFETPWSRKRKKVISTRKIPYKIETQTTSADHILFSISLAADCSINPNKANILVTKIEYPIDYLKNKLETELTNFIQERHSRTLKNTVKARQMLNARYKKSIPYFHISISHLILAGNHINDQDQIARLQDTLRIDLLNTYPRILESTAQQIVEKYLTAEQAKAIANGQDFAPSISNLLQFVRQAGVDLLQKQQTEISDLPPKVSPAKSVDATHPIQPSLEDSYQSTLFRSRLLEAISSSNFRLIQDDPPHYKVEYKGYVVALHNTIQKVSISIYNPQGELASHIENWEKTLDKLFRGLQQVIDRKG